MNKQSAQLTVTDAETSHTTGVLPSQSIRELITQGRISAAPDIEEAQIQPASLDLRLGAVAHRVQASFLPGEKATVQDKIAQFGLHGLDITNGAVLETGCVYIVPLQESLDLDNSLSAIANPKSSTGRLDIFTRLITDNGVEFDRVRGGYSGPLYTEISPRTFSIVVRSGARLNQLRLKKGRFSYSEGALRRLNQEVGLVEAGPSSLDLKDGIPFTVNLEGDPKSGLVGFRARKNTGLIDIDRKG